MALIKCPQCTRLISELATHCPNCDLHLSEEIIALIRAEQKEEEVIRVKGNSYHAGIGSFSR